MAIQETLKLLIREQLKRSNVVASIPLQVNELEIIVEVSDNPPSRNYGLMNRESLDLNCGMLFVFPDIDYRSFWMKNTFLPLSIAYLNESGSIINIENMIPYNNGGVLSVMPAAYALEMNQGWFKNNRIYPGDSIKGLPKLSLI